MTFFWMSKDTKHAPIGRSIPAAFLKDMGIPSAAEGPREVIILMLVVRPEPP